MLSGGTTDRVYLACGATDLRKSIEGLAVLVKECFNLDPFSQGLFVFCNTPKRARESAVVYSLVETAKENQLIPFEYLRCSLR